VSPSTLGSGFGVADLFDAQGGDKQAGEREQLDGAVEDGVVNLAPATREQARDMRGGSDGDNSEDNDEAQERASLLLHF
jgi:hypothetical protein